jgi:2-dehydropantoate 2-reductase
MPEQPDTALSFAVMGAGGVGGYFGARLAGAGAKVAFIARGPHLEAMRASGLRVMCGRLPVGKG